MPVSELKTSRPQVGFEFPDPSLVRIAERPGTGMVVDVIELQKDFFRREEPLEYICIVGETGKSYEVQCHRTAIPFFCNFGDFGKRQHGEEGAQPSPFFVTCSVARELEADICPFAHQAIEEGEKKSISFRTGGGNYKAELGIS